MSLKIKHDDEEFPLPSQFLYISLDECIFINKSRKKYQICCSPAVTCYNYKERQSYFDILGETEDYNEAIRLFNDYVMRCIP